MNEYKILKACFLGKEKSVIKLHPRQAEFLLAGGFIQAVKNTPKKEA